MQRFPRGYRNMIHWRSFPQAHRSIHKQTFNHLSRLGHSPA